MSTAMKSNLFVLHIADSADATSTSYTKVAALTETTLKVTKATIDVTTKDTAGWQSMLEGGGQKSVSITAAGMMLDSETTQAKLKAAAYGSSNWNFKIVDQAGNVTSGRFHISDFEETGAVNGVHTFKCTLASDGAVVQTAATP